MNASEAYAKFEDAWVREKGAGATEQSPETRALYADYERILAAEKDQAHQPPDGD